MHCDFTGTRPPLISVEESSLFVRDALRLGRMEAAESVYETTRRRILMALSSSGLPAHVLPAYVDLLCQSSRWAPFRSHRDLYGLFSAIEARADEGSDTDLVEELKTLQWADLLAETGFLIIPKRIVEDHSRFAIHAARSFLMAEGLNRGVPASCLSAPDFSTLPEQFEAIPVAELGARVEAAVGESAMVQGSEKLIAAFFLDVGCGKESAVWGALRTPSAFSLREANGVDVAWAKLKDALFWTQQLAYRGGVEPALVPVATRHPWEAMYVRALQRLAILKGQWSSKRLDETAAWEALAEVIGQVRVPLRERVAWEDAYSLPEELLPEVVSDLSRLVVRFCPGQASELVRILLGSESDQMGLYTEGFVACLRGLGVELRGDSGTADAAVAAYVALWDHVRQRVFARDARVSALLECALALCDLGKTALAEDVAQEAFRSSNGPGWYKEDQYGLLVDALEAVDDASFTSAQWVRAAAVLEMASGEATFQRWVRSEKERLVDHLAASGLCAEAVGLIQHYNQPSFREQLERISREPVDQIESGVGNRFGTCDVQEQVVAEALARLSSGASPSHRWCIIELFAPCGTERVTSDLFRLGRDLMAADASGELAKRAARMMYADFDPEQRDALVVNLVSETWPLDALLALAPAWRAAYTTPMSDDRAFAVAPSRGPDKGEAPDMIFPGMVGPSAAKAAIKDCRSRNAPAEEVVRALGDARTGGWDIWLNDDDFEWGLTRLFESGHEAGVARLAPLLSEDFRSARDWRVAEQLIRYSSPSASAATREQVYASVVEHVEFLLQPEVKHIPSASPPEGVAPSPPQTAIERYLVSLLDHPSDFMRSRVGELLLWLAERPGTVVDELALRVRSDKVGYGRELASAILVEAGRRAAPLEACRVAGPPLGEWVDDDLFVHAALRGIGAARAPTEPVALSGTASRQSAIHIDVSGLAPRQGGVRVEELADWHVRSFCSGIGMEPSLLARLWHQRCRAEYRPAGNIGTPWERAGVGKSVADVADQMLLERHALCNPRWSEHDLDLAWRPQTDRIIESLKRGEYGSAFSVDSEVIVHTLELARDGRGGLYRFEVAAVLVGQRGLLTRFSAGAAVPFVNAFGPQQDPPEAVRGLTSSVYRYRHTPRVGGDLTPAKLASGLLKILGGAPGGRSSYWRAGRVHEPHFVGAAAQEGIVTTISRQAIQPFLKSVCWVVWGGDRIALVDPSSGMTMELSP